MIRQGDFLVLMHLRSTRTRYRRPRLPQVEETASRSVRTTVPTSSPGVRAEAHTIRPRDWKAPEVSAPSAPTAAANSQIDPVAFEERQVPGLSQPPVPPPHRASSRNPLHDCAPASNTLHECAPASNRLQECATPRNSLQEGASPRLTLQASA